MNKKVIKIPSSKNFYDICVECQAICCKTLQSPSIFHIKVDLHEISYYLNNNLHHLLNQLRRAPIGDIPDFPLLCLKPHVLGYCFYHNFETNLCSIHDKDYYPLTCKTFPFLEESPHLIESCLYRKKVGKKQFKIKRNQYVLPMKKDIDRIIKSISLRDLIKIRDNWGKYFGLRKSKDIENDYGAFYYISNSPKYCFDDFFIFCKDYADFFSLSEVSVNVSIIGRNYKEKAIIQGIFTTSTSKKLDDIQIFLKHHMYKDKDRKFKPVNLFGVIYNDEITRRPRFFSKCLKKLKKISSS